MAAAVASASLFANDADADVMIINATTAHVFFIIDPLRTGMRTLCLAQLTLKVKVSFGVVRANSEMRENSTAKT